MVIFQRTGSDKCEHWLGVLRRMTQNGSMTDTVVQEIRGNPVVSTMLSEILCSQGDSFRFLHDEQVVVKGRGVYYAYQKSECICEASCRVSHDE